MGEVYFKLTGGTETKEILEQYMVSLGFEIVDKNLDKYGFSRTTTYKSKGGFKFKTVWFVNLCHIEIGEFGDCVFENSFTEISASYIPYCNHLTLDFCDDGRRTLKLSIPERAE